MILVYNIEMAVPRLLLFIQTFIVFPWVLYSDAPNLILVVGYLFTAGVFIAVVYEDKITEQNKASTNLVAQTKAIQENTQAIKMHAYGGKLQ